MVTYDEAKRQSNLTKHGIDLADVGAVFDGLMHTEEDSRMDYGERRLQSLGWFRGRVVFLVWTDCSDGPRIISCRYGGKYETLRYFKILA
jgi:uncharacterized DUF497 family protein